MSSRISPATTGRSEIGTLLRSAGSSMRWRMPMSSPMSLRSPLDHEGRERGEVPRAIERSHFPDRARREVPRFLDRGLDADGPRRGHLPTLTVLLRVLSQHALRTRLVYHVIHDL